MPSAHSAGDEHFMRAIVDAPGDDAPRLVYADWLDECDDPRGAYLRATVKLGRGLQEIEIKEKAERQLRHVSRALDPVWVSRVTTPPLGVCCEHIRMHDRGTPISADRIVQLEHRLQIKLPADYRAFLLSYNGGTPEPDVFNVGYDHFSRLQAFFSVGESLTDWSGRSSSDSLESYAEKINFNCGRMTFLPIAATEELHRVAENLDDMIEDAATYRRSPANWETCLCIELETEVIVRVHIDLSPEALNRRTAYSVDPVAKSLPVLLSRLDKLPDGWEPYCY